MKTHVRVWVVLAAAMLLLPLLGGCQANPNVDQAILNNEGAIQGTASVITSAALIGVPTTDRTKTAQEINLIATAIHGVSGTQVDLTGVDALVAQQLAKWNSPDAPMVAGLAKSLETLVQTYVNSSVPATATPDQRTAALQALLAYASQGVMDATAPYLQPETLCYGGQAFVGIAGMEQTRVGGDQQNTLAA